MPAILTPAAHFSGWRVSVESARKPAVGRAEYRESVLIDRGSLAEPLDGRRHVGYRVESSAAVVQLLVVRAVPS